MKKIKDDTELCYYYYYKMKPEIFRLYEPMIKEEFAYVTSINFDPCAQEIWETSQKLRLLEHNEV